MQARKVLYGDQKYPIHGLIPRVVQIESIGAYLVVVRPRLNEGSEGQLNVPCLSASELPEELRGLTCILRPLTLDPFWSVMYGPISGGILLRV